MAENEFTLTHANYYSADADTRYCSVSQYKDFCGTFGRMGCEARALANMRGEIDVPPSIPLMVGSYVDSYFSGTLDSFIEKHPEIISSRGATAGQLKAEYRQAQAMIDRATRDNLFMRYMAGDRQVIMCGVIEGIPFKIMIDSFDGLRITDLKTVESLSKTYWAGDSDQKMNFVEYWGYDLQLAAYREIVRQNTGDILPCYIAAISKDKTAGIPHPRIAVIEISPFVMDEKLIEIQRNITRIQDLKDGTYEPDRCRVCDYCADTEVLTKVISADQLTLDI